jgi:lipopolysaccharide transport system ATP-binding protein
MDAIQRLCSRTLWLDEGRLKRDGPTSTVVAEYLLANVHEQGGVRFDPPRALGSAIPIRLLALELRNEKGVPATRFSCREAVGLRIEWQTLVPLRKPRIGLVLQTAGGTEVLASFDASASVHEILPAGKWVSCCLIPGRLLNEGEYVVELGADALRDPGGTAYPFAPTRTGPILRFEVQDDQTIPGKYYGEEGFRDAPWPGVILIEIPWTRTAAAPSAACETA